VKSRQGQEDCGRASTALQFLVHDPRFPFNPTPVFTAAGQVATLLRSSVAIDRSTLRAGAPLKIVSGTRISLGLTGLLVDASIPEIPATRSLAITATEQIFTMVSDELAVDGIALKIGWQPIIVSVCLYGLLRMGLWLRRELLLLQQ